MTNMQQSICTFRDSIGIAQDATKYIAVGLGGTDYLNLSDILGASAEFLSRSTQYSYYMIKGMQCKFTRCWPESTPLSNDEAVAPALSHYNDGFQALKCNFYPNLKTTSVGLPTEDADSSWIVSPFIFGAQSHYQPFPKNFTTGTNSSGLGVWNAVSQNQNIQGEIAIYNDPSIVALNDSIKIWDVEVNLYISFCNNTGA